MKSNVKTINLVLTNTGLKRFKTIPTFNNLLPNNVINILQVGNNTVRVNHYIYSKLVQLKNDTYDII